MKSNRMAIEWKLIFIEILLICTKIISAQNLPEINYPGTLPGTTPISFATSLIGTPQWVDFRPDGKEIYFQTWVGENLVAKVTRYTGEQWTTPVVTSLRVSPLSTNGFGYYCNHDTIFSFTWSDEGQSAAKPCGIATGVGEFMRATAASNGNLYYPKMDANNNWNLYLSEFENGTYKAPARLSDSINSTQWEQHLFVAPDESYLIYDVQADMNTSPYIYVSFRKSDGTWSARKNTGLKGYVNCVSPDGKYFFFMWGGIKWVDIKVIEKYRPVISGIIQTDEPRIEFYPNPANDWLNITLDETQCCELKVELYTLHGNMLFTKNFQNTTSAKVDLTGYLDGVYLIKVIENGKVFNRRIIKK